MPKWAPCKRRVFIKKLVKLDFDMPEPGGRHFYMRYGTNVLTIPGNDEYATATLQTRPEFLSDSRPQPVQVPFLLVKIG